MMPALGSQLFPSRGYSTGCRKAFLLSLHQPQVLGQMSTGSTGWWTTRTMILACALAIVTGCASKPDVTTIINCAPPPPEVLVAATPLPQIGAIRPDAQDAIAVFSRTLAQDAEAYEILAGRHASIVTWGRTHCNW